MKRTVDEIRTYVDHENQSADVAFGRIDFRTGAYNFNKYKNISKSSQTRLAVLLNNNKTEYKSSRLETHIKRNYNGAFL